MSDHLTLLAEDEAAHVLKRARRTLSNWRYRKCGPAYIRVGKTVRYAQSDLERYVTDNTVEAGAE